MAPTLPPTQAEKMLAAAWKEARCGRSGPEIRADKRRYVKLLRHWTEDKRSACARLGISGKRHRALERKHRRERREARAS